MAHWRGETDCPTATYIHKNKRRSLLKQVTVFFLFLVCRTSLVLHILIMDKSRQKETVAKEEYRSRPPVSYHLSLNKKKAFNSHGSERRQRRGQSQGTAETVVGRQ